MYLGKKYELKYLTEDFYKKYNSVDYPEIENKKRTSIYGYADKNWK